MDRQHIEQVTCYYPSPTFTFRKNMQAMNHPDPTIASAARWFWWIAGLSLVNTVMFYTGSSASFVVGLAMTTVVSVMLAGSMALAVGIIALILGFYFLMGLFAQRGAAWAFYLGGVFYVIDALIYLKLADWMSVAFHAYALYWLVRGVLRLRELAAAPPVATEPG
jgi:hypothetical protein